MINKKRDSGFGIPFFGERRQMNIILLSGGSGQRLWPLSNNVRSKQFIKVLQGEDGQLESMVQRVYRQITTVDANAQVTIATGKKQVSMIRNQLQDRQCMQRSPGGALRYWTCRKTA